MNYSSVIFLINKNVRAIAAIYEPDQEHKKSPRIIFKTLDATIGVGDYVLVPTETRHKMTINKVVEVDVEIDLESATKIDWVISTVDHQEFERVTKMEEKAIEQIKSAQKRKKQEELREALLKDNEFLKALPIANMSDGAGEEQVS